MKNISKYKVDKYILIPLFIFVLISLITIYSAQSLLPSEFQNLAYKQVMWYVIGFAIAYLIMFIGNSFIIKNSWVLYIVGILSLIGLLLFAEPINGAKCWFTIPKIGTIQPSEFMKIILILTIANMINKFNENFPSPSLMEEFKFLVKVMIVVLIPSILTFLQPDTGVVLIYLLIAFVMLFISGIRYRWFFIVIGIVGALVSFILFLFFFNTDLLIKLVGTDFFLRIDRLLDWSSQTGYQLENGMSAIGSGGFLGNGIGNTPIYFPEPQTDFIFAVYANNFGFLGVLILISLFIFFHIKLITTSINSKSNINKYLIAGIVGMLLYQQIQNISMTFGLLPITGITLPFISYGGSSLISYMIIIGLIFNISNESLRYTN